MATASPRSPLNQGERKITAADVAQQRTGSPPPEQGLGAQIGGGLGGGQVTTQAQGQGRPTAAGPYPGAGSMVPGATDPMTGFASPYTPGGVEELLQNPQALAMEVLSRLGFQNPYSGYLPYLQDYAENIPALAYMAYGGQGFFPRNEDIINYANALMSSAVQPGGRAPDAGELLTQLFSTPNDPSNPLNAILMESPDIQDQAQVLNAMMMAATQGYSPTVQRALLSAMDRGQQEYTSQFARATPGTSTPYYQYLAQNNLVPLEALGVGR